MHTGVSVPAGLVPPCSMRQAVQSSGQLMNMQIGSVLVTSGLTAAQAEEIFLLTREVQTLQGKLAIDFIELSHSEATFCMVAQATGHKNTVEEHPDLSLRQHWRGNPAIRQSNLVACEFLTLSSYLGLPKIHGPARQSAAKRLFRPCMNAFGKWFIGLWRVQVNWRRMV